MSKILIIADLHLDMWLATGRDPLAALDPEVWAGLEALIIAGDLSNKPKVRWPKLLAHISRYITPDRIHVFPGNHDYYDHVLDGDDRLNRICTEAGARFVQKCAVVIGRTRFLCCTLWTDFAVAGDPDLAMIRARDAMNDYRYIRMAATGHGRIRPSDTAFLHADHRAWIETQLSTPFEGQTVVVTHHCPHPDLIGETPCDLDGVYGSDLRAMIDRFQPDVWLFGHTHHAAEIRQGRTRIRNVSLGYPGQVAPGDEAERLRCGIVDLERLRDEPT
ncbi:3',5'-cyclic adenosine monophosphate phosphodiesterase CpdA [Roseovarius mucosus]|uniref:3',5'-cyclic adenosine monophosphate phosphodiesterase CpdA n=1 Tax=Roseovarius mucosus TaxID=215743 RepID=A0A1V0RMG4_9RHOB|nr:metallophosphoesterase [Roseovarius mucosus]ARE82886.1 3',5'-cyclic adenosine monophosphate phosphodiesterase CpdA [Roseovarius mucosus]